MARTVSRMREFYRERETQLTLQQVDLNRSINQIVDLTRPRWSDQTQQRGISIELRTELASGLPGIMGRGQRDPRCADQLIFNGVDAMTAGGILTLRTGTRPDEDGGLSVFVEVIDTRHRHG